MNHSMRGEGEEKRGKEMGGEELERGTLEFVSLMVYSEIQPVL